ncbi:beta chain spectrin [Culex quinquefasciatus]|uniref:Beta chain spectrin n=1 Tax=Culex quinquefasciatus TaxID=7176 RepID=B0X7B6_CULQU|nr:beta chain spectrin [Culex quinquefasciatus]|eukprot:XP_001865538.1 beta chain spectrin [Culex quinquefasciatus]
MTSTFPVASDFFQLFADADDIDNWMLGAMRLMSSEDVGQLRRNDRTHTLHTQPEQQKVQERLAAIDARYKELVELIKLRKQRLLDALSLYKLISESDGVERASACRPVAI